LTGLDAELGMRMRIRQNEVRVENENGKEWEESRER
jgi:hypothetical protein